MAEQKPKLNNMEFYGYCILALQKIKFACDRMKELRETHCDYEELKSIL